MSQGCLVSWACPPGRPGCPGVLAAAWHGLKRWFTITCMVGWLYSAPSDALVSWRLPGMVWRDGLPLPAWLGGCTQLPVMPWCPGDCPLPEGLPRSHPPPIIHIIINSLPVFFLHCDTNLYHSSTCKVSPFHFTLHPFLQIRKGVYLKSVLLATD